MFLGLSIPMSVLVLVAPVIALCVLAFIFGNSVISDILFTIAFIYGFILLPIGVLGIFIYRAVVG